MTAPLRLVVRRDGQLIHTHQDGLTEMTARLGAQTIRRASHIERWADLRESAQQELARSRNAAWPPTAADVAEYERHWILDLTPSGGPVLLFPARQAALDYEVEWLAQHYTESK